MHHGGRFSARKNSTKILLSHAARACTPHQDTPVVILKKLNHSFLSAHTISAKANLAHHVDHIVVCHNGQLQLWMRCADEYELIQSETILSNRYNTHKQLAHLPLLVLTLINSLALNNEMKFKQLAELQSYLAEINDSTDQIDGNEHQPIYDHLIKSTMTYVARVMSDIKNNLAITPSTSYIKNVKTSMLQLTQTAADDVLKHMDTIIRKWIAHHQILLNRCRMLVLGPHGPGPENAEKQYMLTLYEHLTGETQAEEDKVYYVTLPRYTLGSTCVKTIIDEILATNELNKLYGEQVLGDKLAMSKDVLASHAKTSLKGMFAAEKTCPYLKSMEERAHQKNEMK